MEQDISEKLKERQRYWLERGPGMRTSVAERL